MRFSSLCFIVPVAFALSACGSSGSSTPSTITTTTATPSSPVVSTSAPATNVVYYTAGSSGATTTNPLSNTSCPTDPSRNYYAYYLNGQGPTELCTNPNGSSSDNCGFEIQADSKLRVSLQPGSAGATTGTGGTMNYTMMAATIELVRSDGTVVASVNLPTQNPASTEGYTSGITISQMSDPSQADFSPYLTGNYTYAIRITNIETDYKCRMCYEAGTTEYDCTPGGSAAYTGCGSYEGYPGTLNFEYYTQQYMCCYGSGTMLQTCEQQSCGVASLQGLTNANWSATILVETDLTTCIPYQ